MDPSKLFRKAALEKLASPERLDEMMQIIAPTGWLSVIAVGIGLAALTVWSVVGSISIKVEGKGMLLRGGVVFDIASTTEGRLAEVLVKPGDHIVKDEVIARLDRPALRLKIQNTREDIARLSGQGSRQSAADQSLLRQYRAQADELRQKIATQEEMVERGLLTNSTLMRTKAELTANEQAQAQLRSKQAGTTNRVEDVRQTLSELENELESTSKVVSPFSGRIVEVSIEAGDVVGAGSRLMTLESEDAPITAMIYIPAAEGKKVRPGMEVYVSPTTVRAEEYGFMLGTVESASDYPVTPEGLRRVLRNQQLIQELTGKSAPIEVRVKLIPDPSTPSGFKWSSSEGPPMKIFSGTICSGNVTVETKKPISYVLPLMRKTVGVS
ncbi:MAG: NHLP bacteriocin system secretion protein [Candidatus Sulfomarinibacteraceae bacterium]